MQNKTIVILGCCVYLFTSCVSNRSYEPCEILEETYVHKYGVTVDPEDWLERGECGQVVSKLQGGVTLTKQYKDGLLHGEMTYTYPHSDSIEKVVVYEFGKKIKELMLDSAQVPREEIFFEGEDKRLITRWFDTGSPESKEIWRKELLTDGEYLSQDQKLKCRVDDGYGTRIIRNSYGDIDAQEKIEGGMCVLKTTFHANGNPKEIIPYKNGLVDGIKRTFFKYGEPNQEETWVEGEQTGTTIVYKNGMLYAKVPYVDGIKDGIEKRYFDGETLEEEVTWKDGIMHGANRIYVGDKINTEWYLYGRPVTKQKYDFQTRNLFH